MELSFIKLDKNNFKITIRTDFTSTKTFGLLKVQDQDRMCYKVHGILT